MFNIRRLLFVYAFILPVESPAQSADSLGALAAAVRSLLLHEFDRGIPLSFTRCVAVAQLDTVQPFARALGRTRTINLDLPDTVLVLTIRNAALIWRRDTAVVTLDVDDILFPFTSARHVRRSAWLFVRDGTHWVRAGATDLRSGVEHALPQRPDVRRCLQPDTPSSDAA